MCSQLNMDFDENDKGENNLQKNSCVRYYSPTTFKLYMEQHIEKVLDSYKQRLERKHQLEAELNQSNLPASTQFQIRQLLIQKESNHIRLQRAKINKDMFTKIKTIGRGAFGAVALVKRNDRSDQLFAMKTMKKINILKQNQMAHVKAERDIMAEADNEWIVKLYFSFQDNEHLYLVMEYIPGGDLMSLLIKLKIFPENLANFFLAEIVLAIESVHKMGFIHRDIKPDNILIDQYGHIKLTDFGLCTGLRWTHNSKLYSTNNEHLDKQQKIIKNSNDTKYLANSIVGTPNYMAPEILECNGYTQSCDWWSAGVILYEMIIGRPPFSASNPVETQLKIINWQNTLKIPIDSDISDDASNLISKMCTSSQDRITCDQIKTHSFFNNIIFDAKILRKSPAPYVPILTSPTDTSNFDSIDSTYSSEYDNEGHSGDIVELTDFIGFTYKRFFTSNQNTNFVDSFTKSFQM